MPLHMTVVFIGTQQRGRASPSCRIDQRAYPAHTHTGWMRLSHSESVFHMIQREDILFTGSERTDYRIMKFSVKYMFRSYNTRGAYGN